MALKIAKRISDKAWGDVDKPALGKRLAAAYKAGEATKANLRAVYLFVPDEAFDKDADGKPDFAHSKAKLPVAEVSSSEIVYNRNGIHAAAGALGGARGEVDMPASDKTAAKRKLRGLYRRLKEKAPDSIQESIAQIDRGKPLEELVKGSLEYAQNAIRSVFQRQFQEPSPYYPGETHCPYYIEDTFADFIVVKAYGKAGEDLMPDEYYKVGYTRDGESITFDSYDQWQVVELAYQPKSSADGGEMMGESGSAGTSGNGKPPQTPADNGRGQAAGEGKRAKHGKRFVETLTDVRVELVEAADVDAKPDGPWRIKAIGNTAGMVNANGRRYPAEVLAAAVDELRGHLNESAGQGRLKDEKSDNNGGTTGEPDHPKDKGNRRPLLLETVVNWNTVAFDGQHVLLEGNLLGTSKGKDIRAMMKGGVIPGISQRGYGDSAIVKENGQTIEEVTALTITGYDFTRPGDNSDADSSVTMFETQPNQEDNEMDPEKMKEFIKAHPELFKGLMTEELDKMGADQLKALEETIRKTLGIDPGADLGKELTEAVEAKKELAERKRIEARDKAIDEAVKELKYGKLNESFKGELAEMAKDGDGSNVKALVESLKKRYDALLAQVKLAGMGYTGGSVQVIGPVIETDLGVPEFARAAHVITESLVKAGEAHFRDYRKADLTRNEMFAKLYLERFDKMYGGYLRQESRLLEEAETTVDLNLPYSVSRAIIAEALPELIATSVFDVGVTDQSPVRIYYEKFAGETGYTVTVTDEAVTADTGVWVQLDNQRLTPGTAVITTSPAGTTYVEGTDYVIDYELGQFMALSGGGIADAAALLADYQATAIRKGEMATIERGELQLTFQLLDCRADRLAQQVSSEAVVFGRSQLGWDATTRTLVSLISQIRRKIDQGLMYKALSASLRVANNSGGTWDSSIATDAGYETMVRAIGQARTKVSGAGRYYKPSGILASETIADLMANWKGFTQAGSRPDASLRENGYAGSLKGLGAFKSPDFSDGYILVVDRTVVIHRVYQPMRLDGPHKSRDATTGKLIAAEEWYAEEFNGSLTPVPEKASHVIVT